MVNEQNDVAPQILLVTLASLETGDELHIEIKSWLVVSPIELIIFWGFT